MKPAIQEALDQSRSSLLSFGGAFSNHLHALAIEASMAGLASIGVVRGEPEYASNPTLSDAQAHGMSLEFVTRAEYRTRNTPEWFERWQQQYPDALIVAEGGSSLAAAIACESLLDDVDGVFLEKVDAVVCACGTGATVAGLSRAYGNAMQVLACDVVGDPDTPSRVAGWCPEHTRLPLVVDARLGGYAACSPDVYRLIESVFRSSGVLLDPVYTAKLLYCLCVESLPELLAQKALASGDRLLVVHTGGLQGWRGKWLEASKTISASTLSEIAETLRLQGIDQDIACIIHEGENIDC